MFLLEATTRVQITDNWGVWAVLNNTAAMVNGGSFNHTNFEFARNILYKPNTTSTVGVAIEGTGTEWTGHCYDNFVHHRDTTAGIWVTAGTKLGFTQNFSQIVYTAETNSPLNPVIG